MPMCVITFFPAEYKGKQRAQPRKKGGKRCHVGRPGTKIDVTKSRKRKPEEGIFLGGVKTKTENIWGGKEAGIRYILVRGKKISGPRISNEKD